jgi:hypothetical protein
MADSTFADLKACNDAFDAALARYNEVFTEYLRLSDCWREINKFLGTRTKPGTALGCIRQYCALLENCASKAHECGYKAMIPVCGPSDTNPKLFQPPLPMSGMFYSNDEPYSSEYDEFATHVFAMIPPGDIKPVQLGNPKLNWQAVRDNTKACGPARLKLPATPITTVQQCQALYNGKVGVPTLLPNGRDKDDKPVFKNGPCVIPGVSIDDIIKAINNPDDPNNPGALQKLDSNILIVKNSGIIDALLKKQADVRMRFEECCGICNDKPDNCPKCKSERDRQTCLEGGHDPAGCPVKDPTTTGHCAEPE